MKLKDFIEEILPYVRVFPKEVIVLVGIDRSYHFEKEAEYYSKIINEITSEYMRDVISSYDEMEIKYIWQDNENHMYIVV